jgi:AraC-like DNA-binding protein
MSKPKPIPIEFRNYELPPYFPVILLSGDVWKISDTPSGVYHFHNCLEIGLCESDSGTLQLAGHSQQFQAGDVTVIASDILHTTYSSPGTASKWSYLFVNVEDLLSPYFPLEIISNENTLHTMLESFCAILSGETYPEIRMITESIIHEMKEKSMNFQFTVRGLMLSLILKLLNIFMSDKKEAHIHTHENALSISPALSYIRTNYMQDFPMEKLAGLCNMSPSHFRRTFKSIMGFGPLEYVKRIRIKEATALLRTTEKTVLAISEEVGYHSLSSFNHHFMEINGTAPLKYRKDMSYSLTGN